MKAISFIFSSVVTLGISVVVGCSSGANSSAIPGVAGPTSCEGACESCPPVTCKCADGEKVSTCSCSADKADQTCADESSCEYLHACDDHGGPSSSDPKSPDDDDDDTRPPSKDAGSKDPPPKSVPSVVEVRGQLDRSQPTSANAQNGTYYLLITDASRVTYTPDNTRGMKFAQSGFSTFPVALDSPSMGTCQAKVDIGLGIGNATVSITGTDAPAETACKSFFKKIPSSGIKAHGTNVKFQADTIPRLNITLTP